MVPRDDIPIGSRPASIIPGLDRRAVPKAHVESEHVAARNADDSGCIASRQQLERSIGHKDSPIAVKHQQGDGDLVEDLECVRQ
jgi:hypothetical protein